MILKMKPYMAGKRRFILRSLSLSRMRSIFIKTKTTVHAKESGFVTDLFRPVYTSNHSANKTLGGTAC
jgi:hypothetical protein